MSIVKPVASEGEFRVERIETKRTNERTSERTNERYEQKG